MQQAEQPLNDLKDFGYVDTRLCYRRVIPHPVAPHPYQDKTSVPGRQAASRCSDTCDAWNLTEREKELLAKLATGLSNKKIAHELGLNPSYFNNALTKIYRKMQVRTRTQALLKFFAADF